MFSRCIIGEINILANEDVLLIASSFLGLLGLHVISVAIRIDVCCSQVRLCVDIAEHTYER